MVDIKPEAIAPHAESAASGHPKAVEREDGTVRASYKRAMLYLPPKAKRKFKEIAFTTDRKEHDIYIEALRDYLEKLGHPGLL
ncbi:hypothetical protein AOQ73_18295 [Bradyrhizobium pachyrhizi]|nr:hypothetical protein AOQ73_18295 [Bradyrhizobium pachyrhizi]